ncbi:MAG: glycosyltransferase family 4 protein [Actinomycetota bacterium]
MRVGIVCPYSFDVPGGVQFHVRDLARYLIDVGHQVSVLAPADDGTPIPDYMTAAGRAIPVPYNGSVARVNIGPVSARRVHRWVEAGDFDVVHIHEPVTPSVSLLALWAYDGPIVATFHTSTLRSRAMQAAYPLVRPGLEKIAARIAVSEDARQTLTTHIGGDAVVIPNGVYVDYFARAKPAAQWIGTEHRPTFAFVGRIDEPRKGLPVLSAAIPDVLRSIPGARFIIAGRGDVPGAQERLDSQCMAACEFIGSVSDDEKAALLRSVDAYVAPHTGGESFGIVLVEAMSAGAPVVASDLDAFQRVLDDGRLGELFPTNDAAALAHTLTGLVASPDRRDALRAAAAVAVRQYDWSTVGAQVLAVYEMVTAAKG